MRLRRWNTFNRKSIRGKKVLVWLHVSRGISALKCRERSDNPFSWFLHWGGGPGGGDRLPPCLASLPQHHLLTPFSRPGETTGIPQILPTFSGAALERQIKDLSIGTFAYQREMCCQRTSKETLACWGCERALGLLVKCSNCSLIDIECEASGCTKGTLWRVQSYITGCDSPLRKALSAKKLWRLPRTTNEGSCTWST